MCAEDGSGPVFTLRVGLEESNTVIKLHGLDVERRQNTLLILQRGVVDVVLIGREDDAHVTQVDVDGSQIGPTQWSPLNRRHTSETHHGLNRQTDRQTSAHG